MKKERYLHTRSATFFYIRKYFYIILGGAVQGFAMGVFLFPNSIPSGGAGGLAVLLEHLFHIPVGIALWLVNFSMLAVAIQFLGTAVAVGTIAAITFTSVSIMFFDLHPLLPYSNVWVDLLIGAAILGIGIAILMRQQVSNGGVGVIALILMKTRGISPGGPLFWINGSIFVITAYVIDWQIIIQALFCQWLSTKIVDLLYDVRIPIPYLSTTYAWRKK